MKTDKNAQQIKAARIALGMSQSEFAKALGLSRKATCSDWERGKKKPPPYLMLAIKTLKAKTKSRELRRRFAILLELDSAGFEHHGYECLCSLDDTDEDCTCGAYRRNQELIAEGNDPEWHLGEQNSLVESK